MNSSHSRRIVDALFVVTAVLICGITAWIGAVPTYRFGHDVFTMLDGAWRVLNGQRPHVDFYSAWGPLPYISYAAGLWLARGGVQGVGYTHALLGFGAGVYSYLICRNRMIRPLAALVSVYLIFLIVAPYPLGFPPSWLSHAMSYNRHGYALISLVMLECWQESRRQGARSSNPGGLVTGALSVALLFWKASFGLVAMACAGLSLLLFSQSRQRLLSLTLGGISMAVIVLGYTGFHAEAIWSNLRMAAAARSESVSNWSFRWNAWNAIPETFALFSLALLVSWRSFRNGVTSWVVIVRPVLLWLATFIAGVMLLTTNAQLTGFPLNGVLAMILLDDYIGSSVTGAVPSELPSWAAVAALALASFVPQIFRDGTGLMHAARFARRNPPASEVTRFDSPVLTKLLLFDIDDPLAWEYRSNGRFYAGNINEGLALVRRYSSAGEAVRDMDMMDPFSYALQRPPALGGSPCMAYQNTFSDTHKPTPEAYFGTTGVLMVPKYPASPDLLFQALERNYGPAIRDSFRLCAESHSWRLYKRPQNLTGCQTVTAAPAGAIQ